MPAVIIDNTAQIRVTWHKSGVPFAINVLHGIKQDPLRGIGQAEAQATADAVSAKFALIPLASRNQFRNSISLGSVGVRDLDGPNNPEFLATPSPAFTFSGTSELLPLNVAACVTLRTDRAGASYRGRCYITGMSEGSSADGVMSELARSASVDVVTAYRDALDAAGFDFSVASRKLGISRPVTSIVSRDAQWDTQRRRIVPGV